MCEIAARRPKVESILENKLIKLSKGRGKQVSVDEEKSVDQESCRMPYNMTRKSRPSGRERTSPGIRPACGQQSCLR